MSTTNINMKNAASPPPEYFEVTVSSIPNAIYPDKVIVGPTGCFWVAGDTPGGLILPGRFVTTQDEAETLVAEIRKGLQTAGAKTNTPTKKASVRHG